MRYTKAIVLILVYVCGYYGVSGQVFIGNFNGDNTINLVRDNPAFALTEDRAQFNFMSAGVNAGGNYILFKRSAFNFLTDGMITPGDNYIKNPANADRSLWLNMEILGPGASFKIMKKYSFAITTGIRYLVNSSNLDNNVFMGLGANAIPDTLTHNTFNIKNYSFTSQVFKEVNFSYAGYLHNTEDYSLTAGATIKLLFGIGAMGVGIPQASFSANNNDGIAYNITGKANFVFTPYANKFALFNSPLNATQNATNNIGTGLDAGMIYYIHVNNTFQAKKNYQARLAVSVTDIGSINYTASSTSGNYTISNQNMNYRNIQNNPQETFGNRIFNEYLVDTIAKATNNISKFKVQLPTAFHFNADVNIVGERFYLNGNILLNLVKPSADKYVNYYISTFTLTPRYFVDWNKEIGFAMPFSYNVLNQGSLGGVAFIGPFYIGSGSFFNMFITNTFKNIDLYTGFSLRIKTKKQKEKDYMMM